MLEIFSYAFNAIAPILLLVLMGYLLKEREIFSRDFFQTINRLVFHYCIPVLLFVNLYGLDSIKDVDYKLAIYLIASIFVLTLVSWILANMVTNVKNRKGVITQAGFRSNFALIGLPLTEGLAGSQGLAVCSSMQAPVVIYYNFFAVLFLSIYSDEATFDAKRVLGNVWRNPLIRGLLAGLSALIIREFIPVHADGSLVFSLASSLPWLYTALTYLARVATPLALIALGGQFTFSQVSGLRKEIVAAVSMRLILAPILGFAMAFLAERAGFITLTQGVMGTLIACYGSPLSVSSVPMAIEMKADGDLCGQIVVWSSMISMITIFGMTVLFRWMGLL